MRLLIVGPDEVYSIENFYAKYLSEYGVTVSRFAAQNIFYKYYQKNIFNKLIYISGLSGIIGKINRLFKLQVKEFKPDVIWIFKGMEITPQSINWAKHQGVLLVNYNPDNPFIFTGRGSGNKNIKRSIRLYDLHFTYNLAIKAEFKKRYNIEAIFLPFGFDISEKTFQICEGQEEIVKACFLGNPDEHRSAFLKSLADRGVEMDVYGNNWKNFVNHRNIKIFEAVHGDLFWQTLQKYRVQINLMRIHNEDSHNMRSFEVPGIGGIQLAPSTSEHKLLFEEGREIFTYNSTLDCAQRIEYLITMPAAEAKNIRRQAREAVVTKQYAYRDRAKQVLTHLERLLNKNRN